jgi:hypothetical protein
MTGSIAKALAYAQSLDALLAYGPDDAEHDALQLVGGLCGGLSIHGFARDLSAALDAVEGTYADREWFAADWLSQAYGVMWPVTHQVRFSQLVNEVMQWSVAA